MPPVEEPPQLPKAPLAVQKVNPQPGVKKPQANGKATIPKAPKLPKVPKLPRVPKVPKMPKVTKPRVPKPKSTLARSSAQLPTSNNPDVKVENEDEPELFVTPNHNEAKPKIGRPSPPPEQEAAVTLALNALEDDATRVLRKEKCAAIGLAAVAKLKVLLQQNAGSFHGGPAYVENCDEILSLGKLPRITVGILGYTGSGKSSLINALVEEEAIVPCNAMRASTSVVVEIAYNESNDPQNAFTAEIEFITKGEWADEFDILISDIKNRPAGEQLTMNSSTDAGLAFAKLSAVYAGIPVAELVEMTPAQLKKKRNLSDILGQTITLHEPTAAKFSQAVNPYIDSSNKGTGDDEFAYWPLVRLVKVFMKSDILKTGLVLVDLPGLGDSNVGRTQVAENYIKKLRHMWVVADIVRAIDDKVASELMSRSFKRQLLMDGRYHENFVTFIMTKTDQLTTHEVINTLKLDATVLQEEVAEETRLTTQLQGLKDELNQQKLQQKQHRRSLKTFGESSDPSTPEARKRSFAETESEVQVPEISDERADIVTNLNTAIASEADLNSKITKIKKAINALNTKMKAVCIKERNRYTERVLEQDFATGQGQLLEELEAGGDEVSLPNVPEASKKSLNTFCVSAKAYQKLQGRFKRDNSVKGFSVNDTNIPSLKNFASQCTLKDREFAADRALTELNLLKFTLELWAENRGTKAPLTPEQREALKAEVEMDFKKMKEHTDRLKHNTMQNIRNAIQKDIESGLANAILSGITNAICIANDKELAYQTWKAIIRRKGEKYWTGKKVEHHWNDEFLQVFLKPLASPWSKVFQKRIPSKNQDYADNVIQSLRDFQRAVHGSVTKICGKYAMVHNALKQVPILEDQIKGKVMEALRAGQDTAQDAHRAVGGTVKKYMLPYYIVANEIKGKGATVQLKQSLEDFAKTKAQPMYHEASNTLSEELSNMKSILSREIGIAARNPQNKLKKDILNVISRGKTSEKASKSVATSELRSQVKNDLVALEQAWMKELENPLIDLRARDPFAAVVKDEQSGDEDKDADTGATQSDAESTALEAESEPSSEEDDSEDEDYQQ